jgi:signal transduction histidine kinase
VDPLSNPNERLLVALLRAAPDAVVILDHHQAVLRYNGSATHLFHEPLIAGEPISEAEDPRGTLSALAHRAMSHGPAIGSRLEADFLASSGTLYRVGASPALDEQDQAFAVALAFHNVDPMVEARKTVANFVDVAVHEIKAPLGAIIGFADLLLSDEIELADDKREDYLRRIRNRAEGLHVLEQKLLDFSRSLSSEPDRSVAAQDLSAIARAAVDEASDRAESMGVHVDADVAAGVEVEGDGDELRAIVTNLLDNAVRFSEAQATVEVTLNVKDRRAVLTVVDRGLGIADSDLPHIFDEFYRGRSSELRGRTGPGLGLAIAKRAIDVTGGDIHLDSIHGEGTTVTVSLPLHDPEANRPMPEGEES